MIYTAWSNDARLDYLKGRLAQVEQQHYEHSLNMRLRQVDDTIDSDVKPRLDAQTKVMCESLEKVAAMLHAEIDGGA